MTQRIHRGYHVTVPPSDLLAALASPEVVRRRCAADGLGTELVLHEVTADGIRIGVSTEIPVDWLPAVVQGRLGSTPTVDREERWAADGDGARSPLTFTFAGMPVRGSGSSVMARSASGTRLDMDLEITVDVPLAGGLVELAIAPRVAGALDAEAGFYATLGPARDG